MDIHKHKKVIVAALIGLVVGGGIGYLAHPGAASRGIGAYATRTGAGMAGGFQTGTTRMNGNGLVAGTIASKDATSITVDTRDGSSKVVLLGSGTTVSKSAAGTLDDVAVGSTVIITGTTNKDGSVSATNVQLRPAGSMPQGAGTPPAGASGQ